MRRALLVGFLLVGGAQAQEEAVLTGAIVDSVRKAPLAGVQVQAVDSSAIIRGTAVTDAQGRYALSVPTGTYDVRVVYFSGHSLEEGRRVLVVKGVEVAPNRTLDVVVPPVYAVSGRIVDEGGAPVARVELSRSSFCCNGMRPAADGTFSFPLPKGEYRFFAVPFPGVLLVPRAVELQVEDDLVLEIVMERGMVLSGRVVDAQGMPLARASVEYRGAQIGFLRTGADGRFAVALPGQGGEYALVVSPPIGSTLYARRLSVRVEGDVELLVELSAGQPTAYFADVARTHLPLEPLSLLSMDAGSGDVDNDGDVDLVVAREFVANVLLLNDGEGRFALAAPEQFPSEVRDSEDVAVVDVDGDGDVDVVVVSEDDRVNEFSLNEGDGSFALLRDRLPVEGVSNAVQAGDVDGDGDADLVIGNGGPGEVNFLLLNDGRGFFADVTAAHMPPVADITQDLELGDVDGDGDLDLVVGNEGDNRLLLNDGTGRFQEGALPLRAGVEETREAALGDADGDGDLDIYFANVSLFQAGADRRNRLLLNDGSGFYTDATQARLPADEESSFEGLFVDVDGDGDADVATANAFPTSLYRAYLNDGRGFFSDGTGLVFPEGLSGNGFDIEAADYNGDGRVDLYLCSRGGADRLLLGQGPATAVAEGERPQAFALYASFPNPFNGQTTLAYRLPGWGRVQLTLYNAAGQRVLRLVDQVQEPGLHQRTWDGRGEDGRPLGSGAYFYRLEAGPLQGTGRLLLLR